jgi:hypothetical protein
MIISNTINTPILQESIFIHNDNGNEKPEPEPVEPIEDIPDPPFG